MSVFEEVCLLSCEQWVDSFPTDIPKHEFSKKHQEKMKTIFKIEQKSNRKPSKKTIKILLIAAILLLTGAITVSANQSYKEYIITKFFDHSEYIVTDSKKVKKADSLLVNYVPEGFSKVEDCGYLCVYENDDKKFNVEKCELNATVGYNTEKYDDEIIEINGIEAIYYRGDNNYKGLLFNNGDYIFFIEGNIDKEELVKIAQNIE